MTISTRQKALLVFSVQAYGHILWRINAVFIYSLEHLTVDLFSYMPLVWVWFLYLNSLHLLRSPLYLKILIQGRRSLPWSFTCFKYNKDGKQNQCKTNYLVE